MTLRELLLEKGLQDLKVINENADLERVVSTVESTETPDIVDYVSKNTLLLTTAMAFKDNQEEMCKLIRGLDEMPCAGLAIKIGRFIDELDSQVIETANQLGFPLIQIPMYQTLGEVYHHVLACVWDNENDNLIYALNVQKSFYNLILQGASVGKLVNSLGMILKKPIFLFSLFGELLGSSNASKKEEKMMELLFRNMMKELGETGVTRTFLNESSFNHTISVYSIQAASYNTHYLAVVEQEKKMNEVSGFVLEQILLIFGIHFYKNFYRSYNEIQMRAHFLRMLINREQKDRKPVQQIFMEGKNYGMKISSYYQIIIGKLPAMEGKTFQSSRFMRREEQYILIYEWLQYQIEGKYPKNLLVLPDMEEWSYVILIQNSQEVIEEKLVQIHDCLKEVMNMEIIFAYGNSVTEAENIDGSYWKAKSSFSSGESKEEFPYIWQYKPQNILELLKTTSDRVQIRDVCIQTLKCLAYPQDEMNMELRKTLKAYLECHCSIVATANKLFVHRNTIRYRIKKCQEILDNDLTDSDYCFQIQLSLLFTER